MRAPSWLLAVPLATLLVACGHAYRGRASRGARWSDGNARSADLRSRCACPKGAPADATPSATVWTTFLGGEIPLPDYTRLSEYYDGDPEAGLRREADALLGVDFEDGIRARLRPLHGELRAHASAELTRLAPYLDGELAAVAAAVVEAHAVGDEAKALELTNRLWDDLHAGYASLRTRVLASTREEATRACRMELARLQPVYTTVSAFTSSDRGLKLARETFEPRVTAVFTKVFEAEVGPYVDAAIEARRRRALRLLAPSAPRVGSSKAWRAESGDGAR